MICLLTALKVRSPRSKHDWWIPQYGFSYWKESTSTSWIPRHTQRRGQSKWWGESGWSPWRSAPWSPAFVNKFPTHNMHTYWEHVKTNNYEHVYSRIKLLIVKQWFHLTWYMDPFWLTFFRTSKSINVLGFGPMPQPHTPSQLQDGRIRFDLCHAHEGSKIPGGDGWLLVFLALLLGRFLHYVIQSKHQGFGTWPVPTVRLLMVTHFDPSLTGPEENKVVLRT